MLGEREVDAFLAACRRRGLKPKSLAALERSLHAFYDWWQGTELSKDRIDVVCLDAYRHWLFDSAQYGLLTQAGKLIALRSFLRFLADQGVLERDASELVPIPRGRPGLRRLMSEPEMRRLCEHAGDASPEGRRDRAYVELLVATAMRPAEAASLSVGDLRLGEARVRIRLGKGDRLRWLPLTAAAVRTMRAYLRVRRKILGTGVRTERVFVSSHGTFTNPLSCRILARAAARTGLDLEPTPYTLRHSVATALARAGMELRHLQALLGHETPRTTELYLHLGPADLKAAHRRAHPRERNPRDPRGRRRPTR